jgi:hypothetical protein
LTTAAYFVEVNSLTFSIIMQLILFSNVF